MASKGRAPKPDPAPRRLYGVPDPKSGPQAPVPAAEPVKPPAGLSEAALAVWDRLAPDLIAKKVIDPWNVDVFGRLCWLQATSEALRTQIDSEGYVIEGRREGEPVKSKAWPLLRQVHAELIQLESRFGLPPADRSRVAVVPKSEGRGPERLLS